ncbi:hypothetical protein [Amycolatopsis sp. H20-H5]|uniref:hypothetical protein n=1 Tax=Amycolatopsis sp. H20-H5 TaxID=3046309 RepID=UPI002DBD4EC2|nr:hypothetical protein [Amycolatopsis sp. H20-H5]MEC3979554.1 hypothetical protein [Amycolatopsis sp. H20-H5]
MSANGEASFFSAPAPPQGDGTQADVPSDTFADPLSGLVTGPGPAQNASQDERVVPIPGPVQHDPEVVRRMVNATLQGDQQGTGYQQFQGVAPATSVSTLGEQVAPPLGMLPQQRTWPSRPPQLLRQRRSKQVEQAEDFDEDIEAEAPGRQRRSLPKPSLPSMPRIGKPSANTAGVLLAVTLMVVFAVVAIQLLISLFSGIAGIFGG